MRITGSGRLVFIAQWELAVVLAIVGIAKARQPVAVD
jgi:hypothetical protein